MAARAAAVRVGHSEDPALAFLAARAAVELDQLTDGRSSGSEALRQVADLLKEMAVSGRSTTRRRALDPVTLDLLEEVSREMDPATVPTSSSKLLHETDAIADRLFAVSKGNPVKRKDLKFLRTYCVALTRALTAERNSHVESLRMRSWSDSHSRGFVPT